MLRIGTSGWNYAHWKKVFYPEDLSQGEWLAFFAESFDTVEVNNTFYQLPDQATVEGWGEQVPEGFLFTIFVEE
jgi:uncharacterized protein YecE (DUF72 family)